MMSASMKIKWDETEQIVGRHIALDLPERLPDRHVRTEHVFTIAVDFKTSLMDNPLPSFRFRHLRQFFAIPNQDINCILRRCCTSVFVVGSACYHPLDL